MSRLTTTNVAILLSLSSIPRLTAQEQPPPSWAGQIQIMILEGPGRPAVYDYYLQTTDGLVIHLSDPAGSIANLTRSGSIQGRAMRVQGAMDRDTRGRPRSIAVQAISPLGAAVLSPAPPVTGSLSFVVLSCRYADYSTFPGVSSAFWPTLLSPQFPFLDNFFREISGNTLNLAGSTLAEGYFLLPHPEAYYHEANGFPNTALIVTDCMAAATPAVDFARFSGIIFQMNGKLGPFAGLATLGPTQFTVNGQNRLMRIAMLACSGLGCSPGQSTTAHEIGHTLGLNHSGGTPGTEGYPSNSSWDFMSVGLWFVGPTTPGQSDESSSWPVAVHPIMYQKNELGWIPPARRFVPQPGTSTTITLERSANPTGPNYWMALVPDPTNNRAFYTVELRKVSGYDQARPPLGQAVGAGLQGEGVVIARVDSTRFNGDAYQFANIVTTDPTGDVNGEGAIWLPGEQYAGNGGIVIRVESMSATSAQILISAGSIPQCTLSLSVAPTAAGTAKVLSGGDTGNCSRQVTVIATAMTDWSLQGWFENGTRVETSASWSFILAASRVLEARFENMRLRVEQLIEPLIDHLFSKSTLTVPDQSFLDSQGNQNAKLDLGDLLAVLHRYGLRLSAAVQQKLDAFLTKSGRVP